MDLEDIVKDAIYYPINDTNRFIRLAIPNIILGLLIGLITLLGMGYLLQPNNISDLIYMTTGLSVILLLVVLIVVALLDSGISLDVIKNTINHNNSLPELDVKNDLVMGFKSFITILIYVLIPIVIYLVVVFLFAALMSNASESAIAVIVVIITIVFYVVIFIISLLMPVILGTLARTNSISQSLQIDNIWNIAKQIGLLNLFIMALIIAVCGFIVSLLGSFVSFIPVIGNIITIGFLYTYLMLFSARCNGLLFNKQFERQNQYQQYNQQNYDNQQYNQEANYYPQDNQMQNNQQESNPLDYGNQNSSNQVPTKTCIACGFANPEDAKHCGNCGKQL
ncbi:DUF4013 domain-containing protein [Methanosphaera sp. BMS]|uniref:DUF4013 domain-containing protein n=1 Tax=Methanosphaera sp. BMS TaxID=1789762 RepID=UPI000DC1DC55|nr:DUF4013 domain-containing protein [Methanosphaera sp. BMS]AWX31749.1 hypothetical protein AW729_01000 [Methanosphaera sp. BMS]